MHAGEGCDVTGGSRGLDNLRFRDVTPRSNEQLRFFSLFEHYGSRDFMVLYAKSDIF